MSLVFSVQTLPDRRADIIVKFLCGLRIKIKADRRDAKLINFLLLQSPMLRPGLVLVINCEDNGESGDLVYSLFRTLDRGVTTYLGDSW